MARSPRTVLVKQIYPSNLTAVGSILFFTVGGALWKSDGTEAGTLLVKEISPSPSNLGVVGNRLFFLPRTACLTRSCGPRTAHPLVLL